MSKDFELGFGGREKRWEREGEGQGEGERQREQGKNSIRPCPSKMSVLGKEAGRAF